MKTANAAGLAQWARDLISIDLRSLAAFRISLGLVLLWDLSTSLSNVSAFYSNDGFLPLSMLGVFNDSPWQWSLHSWSASTAWQIALLIVHLASAGCVLIGYRTQVAIFLCWALLCSLQTRNPVILHSGDLAIRLFCFWGMFLPLGARWSLDEVRGRIRTFNSNGKVSTASSLGILVQICLIYWMGALLKEGVEWRRDGTAVFYALSLDQFVSQTGRYLLHFPELCRIATFGTWWFEVVGPILALLTFRAPFWRLLIVLAFVSFHLALGISFRLGPFAATMLSAWMLFLPSKFWNVIEKRLRLSKSNEDPVQGGKTWMQLLLVQSFTFVCLIYVILWNLRGAGFRNGTKWFPHSLDSFGHALYLDQDWSMFAPRPSTDDGWVIMEGLLANGMRVDLLRGGRAVTFEKPEIISAEFKDSKWHKAILSVWHPPFQQITPTLGNYFAFQWNTGHQSGEQIRGWALWYMREDTLEKGQFSSPKKIELLKVGQFSE